MSPRPGAEEDTTLELARRAAGLLAEAALRDNPDREQIAAVLALGVREALGLAPADIAGEAFEARPAEPRTGATIVYEGRSFTPSNDATTFRCAPTPVQVTPATLLPSATTDPDPAIREALRLAGLPAADVATFEKTGGIPRLRPFAEVFGGPALGEVMRRLHYTPEQFLKPPHGYNEKAGEKGNFSSFLASLNLRNRVEILPARLLLAIPGHFRELARHAPDEREAHTLETFGWLLMKSLAGRAAPAPGKIWWTPTPPPFVTSFPSTLPQLSQQVQRIILSSSLIDATRSPQDYLARFNVWSQGPAGRQWRYETGRAESTDGPGRPFYVEAATVPPPFTITAETQRIDEIWASRLRAVDAKHAKLSAESTQELIQCHPEPSALKLMGSISLGGLELTTLFPRLQPGPNDKGILTSLTMLNTLKPTFELLFKTIYQLGWGDLVFETQGAFCFRGTKGGGAASARNISNHSHGTAVDLMAFENPQGQATSVIDPRIVALVEAFSFKWGRCFKKRDGTPIPDAHHFEYCGRSCAPAASQGLEALAAGIGGYGTEVLDLDSAVFAKPEARPAEPRTGAPIVYGGRPFTPSNDGTIFRCPPTPVQVTPATQLPSETTDPDPAIRTALGTAGLSAAQIATFERNGGLPGLRPFAETLGAAALGEVMARLRYTPARFLDPPKNLPAGTSVRVRHAVELLPARLLLAIPGHFRELARRAPDEREAHALESFGWLLMSSLAGQVASVTSRRWWTPTPPVFVTPFSSTLPPLSQPVQRMILRSMLIDTLLSFQDYQARFNAWSQGPAGRQWRFETGRDATAGPAGRPFYAQVVQIPAAVNISAQKTQIDQAWARWVRETEAAHGAGTEETTTILRTCHPERIAALGLLGGASLGGLELMSAFPRLAATRGGILTQLSVLSALRPHFELLFRTIHELGWGDLLFQTEGSGCFRGNKVSGNLARRAAAARNISNHGYGIAVDLQVIENPQGQRDSTIDPRIVAIFEAFQFRWGRCFAAPSDPDPHHFEYCGAPCMPAPPAPGTGQGLEALAASIGGMGAAALAIVGAGRAEIDCAVLNSHGTKTKNAILRWNAPPASLTEIDVLVHLHGFVGHGAGIDLKVKEKMSGCDWSAPSGKPERSRITLGIIPRGFLTGAVTGGGKVDVCDFPALVGSASGLDSLIQCGLDHLATKELSQPAGSLNRKRLLLTAHSGGGARLLKLLKLHDPDEVEFFDALYQAPTEAVTWAVRHIKADAARLASRPQSEWRDCMRNQGGSLRALFLDTKDTTPHNTALHTGIECALQAISSSAIQDLLRRYYRVEKTAVGHNDIPKTFGWQLLVDASADLTPKPGALARPVKCSSTAQALDEPNYTPSLQKPCIPARPAGADKGPAFFKDKIWNFKLPEEREKREAIILAELLKGNIPRFLRNLKPVTVGTSPKITYWVMPDYLAIGDDGDEKDWVRIPVTARTAQKVADAFCMMLPTAKMVDDIFKQAQVQSFAQPQPIALTAESYLKHHQTIQASLPSGSQGKLIAGHKKDVVLTDRSWVKVDGLWKGVNEVPFYGFYNNRKLPIQAFYDSSDEKKERPRWGYAQLAHHDFLHVDYSHGARLVSRIASVDGEKMDLSKVLSDPVYAKLLYAEGERLVHPARIPDPPGKK
jgi:hypothetical protein